MSFCRDADLTAMDTIHGPGRSRRPQLPPTTPPRRRRAIELWLITDLALAVAIWF